MEVVRVIQLQHKLMKCDICGVQTDRAYEVKPGSMLHDKRNELYCERCYQKRVEQLLE